MDELFSELTQRNRKKKRRGSGPPWSWHPCSRLRV